MHVWLLKKYYEKTAQGWKLVEIEGINPCADYRQTLGPYKEDIVDNIVKEFRDNNWSVRKTYNSKRQVGSVAQVLVVTRNLCQNYFSVSSIKKGVSSTYYLQDARMCLDELLRYLMIDDPIEDDPEPWEELPELYTAYWGFGYDFKNDTFK